MTPKSSDMDKAQTPNPGKGGWWSSVENPLRKAFWVELIGIYAEIFKSDDWFMKRLKWWCIFYGLFVLSALVFVIIPNILGY